MAWIPAYAGMTENKFLIFHYLQGKQNHFRIRIHTEIKSWAITHAS